MKCPEHPHYQGIHAPKSDCPSCWNYYRRFREGLKPGEAPRYANAGVRSSGLNYERINRNILRVSVKPQKTG